MRRKLRWGLLALGILGAGLASAQSLPPPERPLTPDEIAEREKIRSAVEQALDDTLRDFESGDARLEALIRSVERVAEIGPAAVPYVVSELEQEQVASSFFCTYALGWLKTPESSDALRRMIARADAQEGDFATARKAWAGWALGLQGEPDSVDRFNEGQKSTARFGMFNDMSVLELAAVLSAPESVPRLLAQLDRYADQEGPTLDILGPLRALRRVADASTVPRLLKLLDHPRPIVRHEVVRTLRTMPTDETVAALLARLAGDEEARVRKEAALSLERIQPPGKLETYLARLDAETDPDTRGVLYRLVAAEAGDRTLGMLRRHWGGPGPQDRLDLVRTAARFPGADTTELLGRALADKDNRVVAAAALGLARLGRRDASDALIAALNSPNLVLAQTALDQLARIEEARAASPVATLLVAALEHDVVDPIARLGVEKLGEALVTLRHHAVLPRLREARPRQTDAQLVEYLDGLILRLETLERNGNDVGRWAETSRAEDAGLRRLAYERLGELATEPAAKALAEAFGRTEPGEGLEILRALLRIDSPRRAALVERILLGAEFDSLIDLKEQAAWGARRIGGAHMIDVLVRAIDRRNGRDAKLMMYLAVLDGERALPVLARYRLKRMRYLAWLTGDEHEKLDWIAREIRLGRPLHVLDVPPEEITYY